MLLKERSSVGFKIGETEFAPLHLYCMVCSNTRGADKSHLFAVMFFVRTSKRLNGSAGSILMFNKKEAGIGFGLYRTT